MKINVSSINRFDIGIRLVAQSVDDQQELEKFQSKLSSEDVAWMEVNLEGRNTSSVEIRVSKTTGRRGR